MAPGPTSWPHAIIPQTLEDRCQEERTSRNGDKKFCLTLGHSEWSGSAGGRDALCLASTLHDCSREGRRRATMTQSSTDEVPGLEGVSETQLISVRPGFGPQVCLNNSRLSPPPKPSAYPALQDLEVLCRLSDLDSLDFIS